MKTLSQTTGYAILALAYLADRPDDYVQAESIARSTGIRKPYLSKMLHRLARTGLIQSKRGLNGGLTLSRPPREISLRDVVMAVEGDKDDQSCALGLPECSSDRPCPIHDFWSKERGRIHRRLEQTNLAQVLVAVRKGWRL